MPTPRMTWLTPSGPDEASARIPAILRRARNPAPPTATMSFGHLIWTGSAVAARMPSATATPPASVIHGASDARRTIVDEVEPRVGRRKPRAPEPAAARGLRAGHERRPFGLAAIGRRGGEIVGRARLPPRSAAARRSAPRSATVAASAAANSSGSCSATDVQSVAQVPARVRSSDPRPAPSASARRPRRSRRRSSRSSGIRSSVTPPDSSTFARPLIRFTASRIASSDRLSTQDDVGARGDRLVHLLQALRLDLDRHLGIGVLHPLRPRLSRRRRAACGCP